MVRKSWIVAGLVLLLLGVALAAGAQGKKMAGGERLGIIFNIWDFWQDVTPPATDCRPAWA